MILFYVLLYLSINLQKTNNKISYLVNETYKQKVNLSTKKLTY